MTARLRKILFIAAIAVAAILSIATIAIAFLNPTLTRYIEGAPFRAELEKETAKGLHFPESHFAPIRRTGFLSAASDNFEAREGRKAITSAGAYGISARFNPFGVFLRRWQLDELHIDHGEVGIQIYAPKPTPTPSKPWYHVFLPDRVYLKRVWSDPADISWHMRGKKGGLFATHLEITPHGRDFEYRATGGTLKNALIPDLEFGGTHLLITKELFQIYELDLASGKGTIHGAGKAKTRGDKQLDFTVKWNQLPLRPWLPASWTAGVAGKSDGDLRWTGNDFKMETANVHAALRVSGGRLSGVKVLNQIAAIARRDDLRDLALSECSADFTWEKSRGELKNIAIEDEGKFRIEGTVSFSHQSLGGAVQLGLKREYLEWLPNPEEIFSRKRDGYLWTTVHLSGTLESPKQDLSPRLLDALAENPFAFLGAAFRALGAWLGGN